MKETCFCWSAAGLLLLLAFSPAGAKPADAVRAVAADPYVAAVVCQLTKYVFSPNSTTTYIVKQRINNCQLAKCMVVDIHWEIRLNP
jgi:hypothetical protein